MVQVHRMCHLPTFLVICTAAVLDKTKYDLVDGSCKKMCLSKRSLRRRRRELCVTIHLQSSMIMMDLG